MKFQATCAIMIIMILLSTFNCVMGSDSIIKNKSIENISLKNPQINYINNTNLNNSVIYVDQSTGNDTNPGTFDRPKRSIKSAIDCVAENGTINIANGEYTGTENVNFNINKSVSINGHDAEFTIINGNNNQIWTINPDKKVSLNRFTFINGKNDKGGAIYNSAELSIEACVFKNNGAGAGAAVFNRHDLKILNCNFLNNNANQGNGSGGAVYSRQGLCNITDSYFANNNAIGDGGAINNNYEGDLVLVNTKFYNNHARTAGALCNAYRCSIISCEFTKNTVERMGGAIYSFGNVNIDNSQFNDNRAKFDVGGAIGIENGDSRITNSNFTKNHANNYGAISNKVKLSISKTNFCNNSADENGGAVGNFQNLNIEDSNFLSNHAGKYGGAICCLGGLSNLNNNNLINNTAEIGGAVVIASASILNSNHFTSNTAKVGGAIYNLFKGDASNPSINITANDLTDNAASELGGAIANIGSINMAMNNFTINRIYSQGYGGAILNSNGTIYMDDGNDFFHNVINESIVNSGGGISNFNGHIFVFGQGNHFTDSNILNNGYMDLRDCVIEKNTDDGNYLDNRNSREFYQSNCHIINSNHYYRTTTAADYPEYKIFLTTKKPIALPTHFDYVRAVNTNKGSKVHIKSQLWVYGLMAAIDRMIPRFNTRIGGVTVKFRLYDKNRNYIDESRKTSWYGYAAIDIDTSNLKPGKYYLQVSYDGQDTTLKKRTAYLSCLRSVPFTVTE